MEHSIRDVVRRSNHFWQAIFYDELIEQESCQISFLKNSERLYYNAAHVLTRSSPEMLQSIEGEFLRRNITPAVYWDPEAPQDMTGLLKMNGYACVHAETEKWYGYSLAQTQEKCVLPKETADIAFFKPAADARLDQFMHVNTSVNALSKTLASRLRERLLMSHRDVEIYLFLACVDGKPAATTMLGIVEGLGFTAEVATLPEFRRRGLFLALAEAAICKARESRCTAMYVNCDAEAFSNQGYLRCGYRDIFTRYYYQKKMERCHEY